MVESKSALLAVRVSPSLKADVERIAAERGFLNGADLVRQAVMKEILRLKKMK